MNRLIIGGVALIVALYLLFSSIYVVNIREQAIVLRFGQITEVRKEPGLYFKLPTNLIDTVQIIENRLLRYDIANMQLQVSDGAKDLLLSIAPMRHVLVEQRHGIFARGTVCGVNHLRIPCAQESK